LRTYLGLFLVAAFLCWLITPAVVALGQRVRAYGRAREKGGVIPTPRMGGLAILLAVLASIGVLLFVPNDVRERLLTGWHTVVRLLLPGMLVFFVGLYDDLKSATPWQKLAVEVLAGASAWWAGFRIVVLPVLGFPIHNTIVAFFLTVLWIVAVTNSLNLIDGLDGLASGIAFLVMLSVFIVSLIQGNHLVCVLAITFAGALLGFLRFNSSPAQIFLGDTGSLFLGCVLATLAIHTSQKSSTLLALVVPYVSLGLPLLDTLLSVVRRFLNSKPIFEADCDHVHHRLLIKKLTHRSAVILLYGVTAVFSLGSLLILRSTGSLIALVAVLAGVIAWFLSCQLQYDELKEFNAYVSRAVHSQRRVIANQILIRKASKEMENIRDPEKSWRVLADTLRALDFDEVTCQLADWPSGPTPRLSPWRRPGTGDAGELWSVSLPLRVGRTTLGELRLRRSLAKDRMLFQFSSLLDTLIPVFERQLGSRYASQELCVAVEYNQYLPDSLPSMLLANGRGKA